MVVLKVKLQPFSKNTELNAKKPPECRHDIEYEFNGTKVRGWLYLPAASGKPAPLIILSQGFNGTKDAILEKYALKFVQNGYCLLYTSDAADEEDSVDLGGRRIIKKKQ